MDGKWSEKLTWVFSSSELKTILLFHKPLPLSFITLKCGAWSSNSLLIITHLISPMPSSRRKILQQIKHFHYTTDSRSVPKFCGQLSIVTDEIKHWAHQKQTISNKKCLNFIIFFFQKPVSSIWEKNYSLSLKKLNPLTFVPSLVEIGQVVQEKTIFENFQYIFIMRLYNLPLIKGVVLHSNKFKSPLPKDALCQLQVWLNMAQWLWRKRFLKVVNTFSLYIYYLPLEKDVVLHLNKVESQDLTQGYFVCKV